MTEALDLLLALRRTEDGSTWGQQAAPWQLADVAAITAAPDAGPRRHFLVRARGMSKTTDAAGIALALMIGEAPERSRSYIYAVDQEQALDLLDAMSGFVARTPGLAGAVDLGARGLTVKAPGAILTVESSDAASAFGKRPWLVIVDEYTSWPASSNHRRLWSAIVSALPKVPDSRLVVLSMAGSPVGPQFKVWRLAQLSSDWRASSTRGPCPWWSEADIESTRLLLTPAEFDRFIGCMWVETGSALSSEADVLACLRTGDPVLSPGEGVRYTAALDIGTRRDLSALAVAHTETRQAGRVVVVDRVISWRPGPGIGGRVDLGDVEETVARCKAYRAKLQNPAGTHDDLAVAVGMTIVDLTERLDGLPGVFGGAALALIPPPVIPKPEVRDTAGSAVVELLRLYSNPQKPPKSSS